MKRSICPFLIVLVVLFAHLPLFAQTDTQGAVRRNGVDPERTWDLTDVYESPALWEADYGWVDDHLSGYMDFEGRLRSSAETLLACLQLDDRIGARLDRLFLYVKLASDTDGDNASYRGMYQQCTELYTRRDAARAFMRPEIASIDDETLSGFLRLEGLGIYRHRIDDIRRERPHLLSREGEQLLALAAPVTSVPYDTYVALRNVDLEYPIVKGRKGETVQVSPAVFGSALRDTDREYRQRVFGAYRQPYIDLRNTFASLLAGHVQAGTFLARARDYDSALAAALFTDNIPTDVYENLIRSVRGHLEPVHRWLAFKKKAMGLPEMHPYDCYVTVSPETDREYIYDDAEEIILEALAPLGEEYGKTLERAFRDRWIDVYETTGKRTGSYSFAAYGVHPYVTVNWKGRRQDLLTLAHELGHVMHYHFAHESQPYVYSGFSTLVSETAALTHEVLVLGYLIEHAETAGEKRALVEQYLNSIQGIFFSQVQNAEFEKRIYESLDAGGVLGADMLCGLERELVAAYSGGAVTLGEDDTYGWAAMTHLYYSFYLYQYPLSMAAAEQFVQAIKREGQPAVDRYVAMLKAGDSDYPIALMQRAGVDLTTPGPVVAVTEKMAALLKTIEK